VSDYEFVTVNDHKAHTPIHFTDMDKFASSLENDEAKEIDKSIRNIDPEKITAERLNGYAALFGCIALVGAYASTGQIIPGFV